MISWRGRYQFDKIANCITNHHSEKLEEFAVAEMALQLFISLRQDFCTAPYFIVHTVQKKWQKLWIAYGTTDLLQKSMEL